jgi:hypothetical protein
MSYFVKALPCLLFKKLRPQIHTYEFETWPFIPRKEHRLKVYENRALKRMSGRGYRKLQNEELHNSYSSPNIISVIN